MTGALAALDDDLDMIQQQLEHQMQAQDHNQDSARLVVFQAVPHAHCADGMYNKAQLQCK